MKDYHIYDYKQKLFMNPTCDLLQAVLDPDKALGSHFRYFQKQTWREHPVCSRDGLLSSRGRDQFPNNSSPDKIKKVIQQLTRNSTSSVTCKC